tara:strand:- start:2379 stop:2894 length:516 start_codon:yes stop_codon:yes gene_type:complete
MQPNIETDRLILRPFRSSDCDRVALLAGEKVIAEMTANVPHPYEPYMAIEWISTHRERYEEGSGVVYAVTVKGDDRILGAVSLPALNDGVGILGYWIGVPYWGKGYAFEASKALIEFCKNRMGLVELEVTHLIGNERSKSVITKLGVEFIENQELTVHGHSRKVSLYRSLV